MTDLEMFDCFLYLDKRTPIGKKQRLGKNGGTIEKLFIVKLVFCFKLVTVSNSLSTFETDGPFCFFTRT